MRADPDETRRPRIVMTLAAPGTADDPDLARRKNDRYRDAITRAGGVAIGIDEVSTDEEREAAMASMDGLLLTGGADIDPTRYGRPMDGSRDLQHARDALEAEAFEVAATRDIPVLGICRGFQAINVFSGGSLVQHVDGHEGPAYGSGPPTTHDLVIEPSSRLATILGTDGTGPAHLEVNSYHHQAVRKRDLAPGLRATATAEHPQGQLVEALESGEPDRFLIGVQCHPERTETTPAEFKRLFAAFVEAARARR